MATVYHELQMTSACRPKTAPDIPIPDIERQQLLDLALGQLGSYNWYPTIMTDNRSSAAVRFCHVPEFLRAENHRHRFYLKPSSWLESLPAAECGTEWTMSGHRSRQGALRNTSSVGLLVGNPAGENDTS
ncbi:hypothetical protein RRG08_035491 [Elysia crispata]|uniref:Uncharacterized protein n=1 Tax=Elysia crispata TaxID=231223 RepID=A0AAE1AQI1_9GAST|nr:hypothetical protein RRG08_035491 [Elysia crispata]